MKSPTTETKANTDPVQEIVNVLRDKPFKTPDLEYMITQIKNIYTSLPKSQQEFVFEYFKLKAEEDLDYSSKVISYLSLFLSVIALFFGPFLNAFGGGAYTTATIAAYTLTTIFLIALMVTAFIKFHRGNQLNDIWQRGYAILKVVKEDGAGKCNNNSNSLNNEKNT